MAPLGGPSTPQFHPGVGSASQGETRGLGFPGFGGGWLGVGSRTGPTAGSAPTPRGHPSGDPWENIPQGGTGKDAGQEVRCNDKARSTTSKHPTSHPPHPPPPHHGEVGWEATPGEEWIPGGLRHLWD